MGEVYRATDRTLSQDVALKFLPRRFINDPKAERHLLEEVRLARRVSHRNVCRVHDVEQSAEGLFITMELIEGEDLATIIRRVGRLSGTRAVAIAREICIGLAAAHEQGVIHRDLKPANIFLVRSGTDEDFVKVLDFGISKVTEAEGTPDFTRTRSVLGTPHYMAPEQAMGMKDVDHRVDLYALAVVLFECLTGTLPFEADSELRLIHCFSFSSLRSAASKCPLRTADAPPLHGSSTRPWLRAVKNPPSPATAATGSTVAYSVSPPPIASVLVAAWIFSIVPEFLMRFLSWLLVRTLYRLKLHSIEKHVPDEGAALLVCNHVSYMDALILSASIPRPVRFVMYYRIFNIPVMSWIFRTAKAIPIAGAKEDPAVMQRAFDAVDAALEQPAHQVAFGQRSAGDGVDRVHPEVQPRVRAADEAALRALQDEVARQGPGAARGRREDRPADPDGHRAIAIVAEALEERHGGRRVEPGEQSVRRAEREIQRRPARVGGVAPEEIGEGRAIVVLDVVAKELPEAGLGEHADEGVIRERREAGAAERAIAVPQVAVNTSAVAVQGDYDGDRDQDVYVGVYRDGVGPFDPAFPSRVWVQGMDGRFTVTANTMEAAGPTAAGAVGDCDRDGVLGRRRQRRAVLAHEVVKSLDVLGESKYERGTGLVRCVGPDLQDADMLQRLQQRTTAPS